MKKIYLAAVMIVLVGFSAIAQSENGAIKVILQDKGTKEPIPFANIVAYKDGVQVGVATTNMEGEAFIKPLSPGKYSVKGIYVGYQAAETKDVIVGDGKTAYVTMGLSNGEGVKLDEVEIVEYKVPLIDPDTKSGQTVTREDYQNLATKDINSVAATTAGVYQADEGQLLNVRGGRQGATTYFVDGVKVYGSPTLPQQSIEQLNIITGGVPASYGDLTSGVVSISTRGPQSKFFGGVELMSSELTDAFGYNLLGFSMGGPLYKKKDSTHRTVLGFFISGQGNYLKDPSPSAVPIYRIKDDKLQDLKDNPLRPSPSGTGFVRSSEFVTFDDFNTYKTKANVAERMLNINGKVDWAPTVNTNISLGGFYSYNDYNDPSIAQQLLNSANTSQLVNRTLRGNISFTQKFGAGAGNNKQKSQSLLTNAYFRFIGSYENVDNKVQSAQFKTNFFDYGYVGKFDRSFQEQNSAFNYSFTPSYMYKGQAINAYTYLGRTELPVKFTAGTQNPDAAAYTSYLVGHVPTGTAVTMDYIAGNNGLRNGDQPLSIYNLFTNFGTYPNTYQNSVLTQLRFVASVNADIKNHGLQAGLEFDQRRSSFFSLDADGLWNRMRQIANVHTTQLDVNNPILNTQLSGLVPYYYYNYAYDQSKQTQFSEQLLAKLGLPRNYTGFVNIDGMDPSTFKLSMFSADDLLNNGSNSLVSYVGYTHDGKKTNAKTDINDFINQKDANGRNLFPVGSFNPIYSSVYIMDKFDFKDMKFNIGLRVDRYDANQQVLKDKYAFHDIARIGDLGSLENLPAGFTDNIPGNLPKDAAVYVAQDPTNGKSPIAIKGYREGDKWYNAQGVQLSDPSLIVATDGRVTPLFKDNANYSQKISAGGFTRYVPAINAMPRIAFSFPISDVANFFAHYDILVQRPTTAYSNLSPLDYYYIDGSGNTSLVNNPNLKPTQTIDYELGFSQVLNERKNASLTITSFYREMRNMINQKLIVGAYPKSYIQYDNIDFGTVKGISAAFDFRRTGGSRINLNYTLQFADGSGSNANSGANLASTGQPNLRVLTPLDYDQRHSIVLNYDYRFGSKKDYKGPSFKTKKGKTVQFLENIGLNLSLLLGSGTPYTRWSSPANTFGNGRSVIQGQINGSYKPWNFRTNLKIDKNIPLTFGSSESENRKTGNLNIYVQILNVLNTKNVLNVYNFTGSPNDDGYLSSAQAQAALALANSAQAYSNMYTIRMRNTANYSLPRQIRIGVLFEF